VGDLWRIWRSQCFEADSGGGEGGGDKGGSTSGDANPGGDKGTDKSGGDGKGDSGDKGFKAITSQEEFDAALKDRLARHEKAIAKTLTEQIKKQLKDEADAAEATKQGDFKKLYEAELKKREDAEKERDAERLIAMRSRIAAKHKLAQELADRLSGTTEEEIEADAKALAKIVGPRQAPDTEAGSGTGTKPEKPSDRPNPKPKQDEKPVYDFNGQKLVPVPR
jgi:hypothetical protein